jgi:hypothetical protein
MLNTIEKHGKVRTVFLLDSAERRALEQLSGDTGAPVAELLRRSVASWLQKHSESLNHGEEGEARKQQRSREAVSA